MVAIMLLMIAVGMVLDLTPTILILGPVLAPIAIKAGIDPVYFGVMFVLIGSIGLITPPVGTVLNVVGGIGRLRMETLVRGVMPFFLVYGDRRTAHSRALDHHRTGPAAVTPVVQLNDTPNSPTTRKVPLHETTHHQHPDRRIARQHTRPRRSTPRTTSARA